MKERQRFAPQGALAIDPQAFGMEWDVEPAPKPDQQNGVAVVNIRGPLMHHAGWFFDSYEGIRGRVAAALEAGPQALVLRFDSPGGLVNGMIETARALRAMADEAEVPMIAYVDGSASSAAYALACACDRIVVPPTGVVGSVGILDVLTDATAQAEMFGLKHRLVTSGARKADGNPIVPISDEAVAAVQQRVDELAGVFFAHVAERRSMAADDLAALEAALATGAEAVRLGLADEVMTFDDLLASIASGEMQPAASGKGDPAMDNDEQARKALQAIIEDEDADDKAKARARRALKAMDEDDDKSDAKKAEDDKEPESKKKAKAEDDDEKALESKKAKAEDDKGEPESKKKAKAEDDDEDAKAVAMSTMRELHALRAEMAAEKETAERKELLASRPDFDEKTLAFLEKLPLAQVKDAVETFPRGPVRNLRNAAAATAQVGATRGDGQGGHADRLPPDEARKLDEQMGLHRARAAVEHSGTTMSLRTLSKADARAYAEQRAKEAQRTA